DSRLPHRSSPLLGFARRTRGLLRTCSSCTTLPTDEKLEDFTDRPLTERRLRESTMLLYDIPIPAAVALLEHVPGGGQVTHDPVGTPFSDAQRLRDSAQAHPGVVRDAQQRSPMTGEEAPFDCHVLTVAIVVEKFTASIEFASPGAKWYTCWISTSMTT